MTMKRKRSNKSDAIDWIELSSDATKLERERQYLCSLSPTVLALIKRTDIFFLYILNDTLR